MLERTKEIQDNNEYDLYSRRCMFFCEKQFSFTDGEDNFKLVASAPTNSSYNPQFFTPSLMNESGVMFKSRSRLNRQDDQFLKEVHKGTFDHRL